MPSVSHRFSQVRDSVLAAVSGAGAMIDSSIDASAFPAAATGASAADGSEKTLLRRSLSSEFFAGKGAMQVFFVTSSFMNVTVTLTCAFEATAAATTTTAAAVDVPTCFFKPAAASRCSTTSGDCFCDPFESQVAFLTPFSPSGIENTRKEEANRTSNLWSFCLN
jgi:hypothetical protein